MEISPRRVNTTKPAGICRPSSPATRAGTPTSSQLPRSASSVPTLQDLPTPQVVVDRSRLLNNIARVQGLASGAGMRLRPHAKTHKSPIVAKMQIERGAIGICCAKVVEAGVVAAAGTADIRLPYPVNRSH